MYKDPYQKINLILSNKKFSKKTKNYLISKIVYEAYIQGQKSIKNDLANLLGLQQTED